MKNPLILLHGALGSKKNLEKLAVQLSKYFTVYSINFEGHGSEKSNRDYRIKYFGENLLQFLDEKNLERVNVFGYSMGGYVALKLALEHPEKIEKLITLGTKFNWSIEAAQKEVKMLNPDVIEEKVPQFKDKLKSEHSANDWKTVLNKSAEMMLNLAQNEKLTDIELQNIEQSILITLAAKDYMVTKEESEKAASTLSNAQFKLLKSGKHPIESIEIDEIVRLIISHVST